MQRVAAGGLYVEADIALALAVRAPNTGDLIETLTTRDPEIIRLLGDGRSLSEIAAAFGVT